jgi:hypothetical protein
MLDMSSGMANNQVLGDNMIYVHIQQGNNSGIYKCCHSVQNHNRLVCTLVQTYYPKIQLLNLHQKVGAVVQ